MLMDKRLQWVYYVRQENMLVRRKNNMASRQEATYGTLISSPHGRFKRF